MTRPKRRLGQHFLHDPAVIERIVAAADPRPGDAVVEIGPGLGALTVPLLRRLGRLDVVELDRELLPALAARCEGLGELRIHAMDALALELAALGPGPFLVVGNLPYNVSTPLLFRLLGQLRHVRAMCLMLQHEVVARMAAAPGGRDYGRLSVAVQARCAVRPLFRVGPGAFRPPPRVWSTVVRLEPLAAPAVAPALDGAFDRVLRAAFGQRRKTLRNALAGVLAEEAITAAGIDPRRRPETLTVEEFARLARQAAV
ncbi:16S rRNA (adenine(1518)-N(6)/adenine(1519)-N(6))-dimethyltransferase RsmA [Inmirania thermothiophila]|uniref:Ribosomal RNA small subunit methyltransferase A n=1 Tax=Inmirania thermothiophila TaxID=1750597 RepID=A0A3N1Y763_9GAMM|nr:16S rRNA (adenine(1518)-N(6)/adenine(1519)-N(6))-dimethyltransferase RsmA [Inmirania thermothiophila]ROR34669.1 dimethyladenosine transferase [Inmirania thermothiophila]